jgi:tricorn protease
MFHEVWRIEREFFYDPHYHGLDLQAAEERYGRILKLASRDDLNYLFTEMLGNLTVGHMFLGGGDRPDVKHVRTGLLGADYKIENGRYRFARVYDGENWNPDLKAPLTQPGVNVWPANTCWRWAAAKCAPPTTSTALFEETAGKTTLLKVGPDPSGANAREVKVVAGGR